MAKRRSRARHGLGSVFKRKDGRWVAQVCAGYSADTGKPKYRTAYSRTEQDAKTNLKQMINELDSGQPAPTSRQTVGEFLDKWLDECVKGQKEPKTIVYYTMMVNRHIKPSLGRIELRKLQAYEVQSLINEKTKPQPTGKEGKTRKLSPATVNGIRRVLRAALNQAWKWDMVVQNVVPKTSAPKVVKPEPVYLEPDQAQKLLEQAKGHPIENLVALAMGTGLRIGEATGLRWQDVDVENATLRVQVQLQRIEKKLVHKPLKSASSRRNLPLLGMALEAVRAEEFRQASLKAKLGEKYANPLGLVFLNSEGRPLDPKYVDKHLKQLCKDAGIPQVSFHKLRHTAATHMVAAGVPLALVKDQLGHSSITLTTGTYAHMVPAAQREAAEKLDAVLRKDVKA